MEKRFHSIIHFWAVVWALIGGVGILAIMLITSINVGAFVLNQLFKIRIAALPGYEDFISLTIAGVVLMFFPYCQSQKGHVVVDLFANKLPLCFNRALERVWLIMLLFVALFLAYWMVLGMLESYKDGVLTPILGWIIWPSYFPGVISLVFWALVCFIQIFDKQV